MRRELHDVAVLVDEVLEEVPLDIVVRALILQVLVKVAHGVALDINFGEDGELDTELRRDPILDFLLVPGLLRAELVAGVGQDLEASRTVLVVHGFVRAVVRLSDTSLGGDVDNEDGLRIDSEVSDGDGGRFGNAAHHDVEERRLGY
eukprot:CAMPEP_0170469166 /NCGR_PEP_ID=MMETSP0123-20130129/12090_1 /TAXON_ID=182087 /ORGANISM="Favella ehrenbergii, Strain Fehren 1" /LENGTH=146 /DNA_ID=CAMNT_0010735951 /DNA_START=347 /DNA_END=784 /DNA_ORIENTATION=+